MSQERDVTFPRKQDILKLCLKDYIFRGNLFLAEVTFTLLTLKFIWKIKGALLGLR